MGIYLNCMQFGAEVFPCPILLSHRAVHRSVDILPQISVWLPPCYRRYSISIYRFLCEGKKIHPNHESMSVERQVCSPPHYKGKLKEVKIEAQTFRRHSSAYKVEGHSKFSAEQKDVE